MIRLVVIQFIHSGRQLFNSNYYLIFSFQLVVVHFFFDFSTCVCFSHSAGGKKKNKASKTKDGHFFF